MSHGALGCHHLVQRTLNESWSQYQDPLPIDENDLSFVIELFAQIVDKEVLTSSPIKEAEKSLGGESVDKIKKFVRDKAFAFRAFCKTGFPFSLLKSDTTEHALRYALGHYEHEMSENELNERFKESFKHLQVSEIAKSCSDLKRAYFTRRNNKAGYYLLWLIKQATGCTYKIPEETSFDNTTVVKVLSNFLNDSLLLTNPANFVEILYHRDSRIDLPLYQELLNRDSQSIFLKFAVEQMTKLAMDTWPGKANVITDYLEREPFGIRLTFARDLASSRDRKTSEVGNNLLGALQARSLREAIPHFMALSKLLPHVTDSHIEIIFHRPFVRFCYNSLIYQDPDFARRLRFNCMNTAFVHGSLMIGVYYANITYEDEGIPPYLLAYDMNTEEMVWGTPLAPVSLGDPPLIYGPRARFSLERVGALISLHFEGEKKVHFIDSETGEFNSTLELPKVPTDRRYFHISPKNIAYQVIDHFENRSLIGAKIICGRWVPSFETKAPMGLFDSFSTHFGFWESLKGSLLSKDRLVLFGPKGDQIIIENCIAAKAQDNKLYSIEKDPVNKDRCLLNVRTLKDDHEVVSSIEKSIPLNVNGASFNEICQNGQVILFADDGSLVFVHLNSQEIKYDPNKDFLYKKYTTNVTSGTIWFWNEFSEEVKKISSDNTTMMGRIKGGQHTILVHADEANRLYFLG